jgi:hypothetical protein
MNQRWEQAEDVELVEEGRIFEGVAVVFWKFLIPRPRKTLKY